MMRDKIKLADLESVLWKSWSQETSADSARWTKHNPAWGQCAVTALVVQDFLGGLLWRLDISKHPNHIISVMRSHYFNNIDFCGDNIFWDIDLSESQFGSGGHNEVRRYAEPAQEKTREYLLNNKSTKERYKKLRYRVNEILSGENPIFKEQTFMKCLMAALDSNCQKGKYGCVVKNDGQIVVETFNSILDVCQDWSEPECIRVKNDIPSRTESMIGCCSHAEEEALRVIRNMRLNPRECELYVAGFRSNGLVYIKSEPVFTCLRCAIQLHMHGIGAIHVPCREGWAKLTAKEAVETAKKFATQEKVLENYTSR